MKHLAKHEAKYRVKHEACLRIVISAGLVTVASCTACLVIYIIDYYKLRDIQYIGLSFKVGIIRSALGLAAGMVCFLTSLIIERVLLKEAAREQSGTPSEEAPDKPEE